MRLFVSRRIGRNWRAGVSLDPRELSPPRRRGRPLANVAPMTRPARSYYGVALDQPDLSAELPRERHPWRALWSIVATLAWLLVHGIIWAVWLAVVLFAGAIIFMRV